MLQLNLSRSELRLLTQVLTNSKPLLYDFIFILIYLSRISKKIVSQTSIFVYIFNGRHASTLEFRLSRIPTDRWWSSNSSTRKFHKLHVLKHYRRKKEFYDRKVFTFNYYHWSSIHLLKYILNLKLLYTFAVCVFCVFFASSFPYDFFSLAIM